MNRRQSILLVVFGWVCACFGWIKPAKSATFKPRQRGEIGPEYIGDNGTKIMRDLMAANVSSEDLDAEIRAMQKEGWAIYSIDRRFNRTRDYFEVAVVKFWKGARTVSPVGNE